MQAIALQTLATTPRPEQFRDAFAARLQALSKTHNLLAAEAWTGVDLGDVVAGELDPYRRDGEVRAHLHGDPLLLTPKVALALSMAMHELATNAAKYRALSSADGEVTVRWRVRKTGGQRRLLLHWHESGGPPVHAPNRKGFGTRLIGEGLAFELDAEVNIEYAADGVVCRIELPLETAE